MKRPCQDINLDSRPRIRGLATYIISGFSAAFKKEKVCTCHKYRSLEFGNSITAFDFANLSGCTQLFKELTHNLLVV